MQTILTVASMRASDAAAIAAGVSGQELMSRAAHAIYEAAAPWKGPAALICGKGNNGGDGYALACLLQEADIPCTIFAQGAPATPEAAFFAEACAARKIPVRGWAEAAHLQDFRTVVDCIFGTGFRGAAEGEAARMIGAINGSGAFVVSADINSGLNGDNGLGDPAVVSDLTVSIGSLKPGHFLGRAKDVIRKTVNADIGIPPLGERIFLMEEKDGTAFLPPRPHFSNKGTYGTVALIGGSVRYAGAIRLAAMGNAAMRSGAGIARIAAPASLCPVIASSVLESTLFPLKDREGQLVFDRQNMAEAVAGTRATAFGMGLGNTEETRSALQFLLREYTGILILDADGLNALAALGPDCLDQAACRVILTPHPGEFARLTGRTVPEVLADPAALAREFAQRHAVTLLLKGTSTLVTDGEETWMTDTGCPGMATAGSGDVLSGVMAAMCGWQSAPPVKTAAMAAWINGKAGELAQQKTGDISMIARDTVAALPEAFRRFRNAP